MLTQAQNIKAVLLSLSAKISAAKAEAKMIEVFGSLVWGGGKSIRFHQDLSFEILQFSAMFCHAIGIRKRSKAKNQNHQKSNNLSLITFIDLVLMQ